MTSITTEPAAGWASQRAHLLKTLSSQLPAHALLSDEESQRPYECDGLSAAGGLDGVSIRYTAAIQRLFGEGGQLTGVEVLEHESGQTCRLAVQRLILAAGRFPEMIFIPSREAPPAEAGAPPAPLAWEGVLPYKHPWHRDQSGIYAEGDVLTDYSAAIKAIGAGRRAAASIHQVMNGIPLELDDKVIGPQSYIQNVSCVEAVKPFPRQIMPICSGPELKRCGEIERGFSEDLARKEAGRCLQCGLICYRTVSSRKPTEASLPAFHSVPAAFPAAFQ